MSDKAEPLKNAPSTSQVDNLKGPDASPSRAAVEDGRGGLVMKERNIIRKLCHPKDFVPAGQQEDRVQPQV